MTRETKILKKEQLEQFLDGLIRERTVFAPTKRDNERLFGAIGSAQGTSIEAGTTKNSLKSALFPQTERLFLYRQTGEGVETEVPPEEKELVLFGIRPCDARSLVLLDGVFQSGIEDPYFSGKRKRSLVIAMACATSGRACFCTAVGGSPCATEGSDLLLLDLGDRYLVEAATDKGKEIVKDRLFEATDEKDLAEGEKFKAKAEAAMDGKVSDAPMTGKTLEEGLKEVFDDPLWEELTETCMSCGVCTYLCPTCHCFDICDETALTGGERIRIWDSCQFPLFTRQASGFNPRPTGRERFRQRIMHKFSYLPENGNITGCVGCGRCVTECPVNLDIREVVSKLARRTSMPAEKEIEAR